MEKLNKQIRNVWIATSALIGVILSAILATGIYTLTNSGIAATLVGSVPVLLLTYYSVLRYRNWFFQVEDEYLEINHGVIRKVSAVIPFVRVQHIDTNRGPLERILGLASIRIYTAGSKGADMRIPGLKRERAEKMQEELRDKAIESEQGFDGV
jgi:membrane protein YdbS with pleckstrin-like domain